MSKTLPNKLDRYLSGLSRRQLLQGSAVLGAAPVLRGASASVGRVAAASAGAGQGSNVYERIGVHPVINCRGTFTVIGGSLELPEVTAAQQAAAQHYVQLDELADGIGARLAELTGAEWGMVSSGCAAGLAHATASCIAGESTRPPICASRSTARRWAA